MDGQTFRQPEPENQSSVAWAARDEELARWAEERLVVRPDCHGAYTPPERRGQAYPARDGTVKTVPASYTAKGKVTHALLARHFRGARPEHVVGLHSTSTDNSCLAARIDIDAHGPNGNDPVVNLRAALAWYERLTALGFRPLLNGSNGKGGYHLSALFSQPVPSPLVFAFLKWLTDDHARHGLTVRPEVFPKQPCIGPGKYGNWLRLPGRHHTRPYWAEVWNGERWLAGTNAVAHILSLSGDPAMLIPPDVKPAPPRPAPPPQSAAARNPFLLIATGGGTSLRRRIAGYMGQLPNLGEGQGRDDIAFRAACWLVRDMQLPDETALGWLRQWDGSNRPPKGEEALRKAVGNAHAYGQSPYGCGLGREPVRRRGGHVVRVLDFTVRIEV
jgi:hypothetical protein